MTAFRGGAKLTPREALEMLADEEQDLALGQDLSLSELDAIQKKKKVEKFAASILQAFEYAANCLPEKNICLEQGVSVSVQLKDCDSGKTFEPQFFEEVLEIVGSKNGSNFKHGICILNNPEIITRKLAKFFWGNSQKELKTAVGSFNEAANNRVEGFALRGVEISNGDCGWGIMFTAGGPNYLLRNALLSPEG